MNAEQIRNLLSNRKRPTKIAETSIMSELDGQLLIRRLSGQEGFDIDKITDDAERTAILLRLCITVKDTGEQLFQPTHNSLALDLDLPELKALAQECLVFNGLIKGSIEAAKNA